MSIGYFDERWELHPDKTNVVIVENPETMRNLIQNLVVALDEDNDDWIFSEHDKILKKKSCLDIVFSLFTLDLNSKKIQKAIVDRLYDVAMNEVYYDESTKLLGKIEQYLYKLEWEVDFNVSISLKDFHDVIKVGVSGIMLPDTPYEKIVEYIKLSSRLLKTRIIVLIGVQGYFNKEEWRTIETTAIYENIYLICLENKKWMERQNEIIFDYDNCRVI